MCGIVGFTGSQNAAPILLDGLKKLEYRGYDSAGMAVLGQDGIQMVKTIGMIKNLDNKTQGGAALPGTAGIGHTRWATHGEPTDVNAHPHMSNDDKFAIVHNGIIENYAQLREELKAKGFQFKSETDTEVIVHLLDLYYEGDLKKAVLKTVSRLEGAYALGILCAEEGGRLIATRHAAPLIVGVGIGENYFASDVTALVAYTKNVIYLEDGEIAVATTKGYTTQVAVLDMLAVYLARRLGKLDDQRNKELVEAILQFPSLIQRAIDLNPNLPALAQKYHGHNDMFFIGRNVDYAASMEGSLKLKEISYLHSEAYAAGELKHGTIALIEKDRPVIALACYEALFDKMMSNIKEVKARGAQVLAVVLEGNRQIFAEADDVIFVPRTEALFNSLPEIVPLQLFAYYVARANGCDIDKPKNLAKSVTVE